MMADQSVLRVCFASSMFASLLRKPHIYLTPTISSDLRTILRNQLCLVSPFFAILRSIRFDRYILLRVMMFVMFSNVSICLASYCFVVRGFGFLIFTIMLCLVFVLICLCCFAVFCSILLNVALSGSARFVLIWFAVFCSTCLCPNYLAQLYLLLLRISHSATPFSALQSFDGFLLVLLWFLFCLALHCFVLSGHVRFR